jgi:hypothetical protein
MEPVQNRLATPRRRGRPSADEVASRPPPVPAKLDAASGRPLCQQCGRPGLVIDGRPRKSDGGTPQRCQFCGTRCVRIVMLDAL